MTSREYRMTEYNKKAAAQIWQCFTMCKLLCAQYLERDLAAEIMISCSLLIRAQYDKQFIEDERAVLINSFQPNSFTTKQLVIRGDESILKSLINDVIGSVIYIQRNYLDPGGNQNIHAHWYGGQKIVTNMDELIDVIVLKYKTIGTDRGDQILVTI